MDASTPASVLYSKPVKSLLTERLVRPAINHQWGVMAVRYSWPHDELTNKRAWEQIARYREELDQVVAQLSDCLYFVSAIGGTPTGPSGLKWGHPGVNYWIVNQTSPSDQIVLLQHLTTNQVFATPKMLLQPYQQRECDFNSILFKIVKDNIHGCVPRLVQESWQRCYGSSNTDNHVEPAVRIYVKDPSMENDLRTTVSRLRQLRFPTKLIHMK